VTRTDLVAFMQGQIYAVQATTSRGGGPQAAVVGIVVTDDLCIFFDTLAGTRKAQNLRRHPRIAFVIGGLTPGEERTVQYEGVADEPKGSDLESLKHLYFARFPDGREREHWPGITYVRVRPAWIRYSDYRFDPPEIVEYDASSLAGDANQFVLTRVYAAFNDRDIDGVLATMDPAVEWPNGLEGGFVHGHQGVRDYWSRQWASIDPHVEPKSFETDGSGRTTVAVHQIVRDLSGNMLLDSMVRHVYSMRNGLIARMEIEE
jgi:hypothetical protein